MKGKTVVDATAGNGYDTAFLVEQVGPEGHVISFDIQSEALEETRRRIEKFTGANVSLIHDSHEKLHEYINVEVQMVIYNLGYLPGKKERVTTKPETTLVSVKQALSLLAVEGLICITFYTGNPLGAEEFSGVNSWAKTLDEKIHKVLYLNYINAGPESPSIMLIQRLK